MAIFKDIPRFDDTGITEYYRVNDGKVVKLSSDYDSLDDKPTINGVTIEGDLTTETLNIPIGNMEELRTNIKDNLVNAINELSIETESFANSITDKVNSIISFTILWVEVLPADENAKKNTVYLVPKKSMIEDDNYCEEYLYTDHGWEKIGDTKVDLSGYYTKTETDDIVETMMGQIQITYATRAEVNQSISNLTQSTNQSIANLSQEIHNTIGDMTALDTDAKNTIVEALNELQAEVNAVGTPILFTGDYFHIDTQPAGNYYFGGNTKGYGWSGWIGVNTGMTGSYAEMVVVDDNTRFARIFNTRNEQTIIGKINGQYYNFTGEFLTGDEQYINGQKTFYDIPYIGSQYSPLTPTENSHAANKKYVDDAIKTGIDSIDDNIYRIVLTTNTRSNTGNGSSNLNATDRQAYADWLKWYQSKLGTPTVLEFYCTGNYFGAPSGTHKHLLGRIEFNGGAFPANKDICVTGMYAYNVNGGTMDTMTGKVGDPVYTIYITRVYFRTDIDSNGNYIPHSAFNGTYTTCPSTFGDADYQNSRIDIRTWLNTVAYTPTGDYNAATKKYVDDSITSAIGDIVSFGVELVEELPTENISTSTVYMVPAAEAGEQNIREEYLYTEHGWEMVGSTQINLENYYATKDEVLNILYPQTEPDINIDIDGFDILTYVENTDTAYFDTQLYCKAGNTYNVEIKMSITDPANSGEGYREGWVFGCYEHGGWRAGIEMADENSSFWDTSGNFTYDPQELTIDQTTLARSEFYSPDDWSTSAGLFVQLEGGEYNPERRFLGKIYYCHIWENDVLVRSLIPVRHKESGVIGLYDTVNGAFLTSPNPGLVGGAING